MEKRRPRGPASDLLRKCSNCEALSARRGATERRSEGLRNELDTPSVAHPCSRGRGAGARLLPQDRLGRDCRPGPARSAREAHFKGWSPGFWRADQPVARDRQPERSTSPLERERRWRKVASSRSARSRLPARVRSISERGAPQRLVPKVLGRRSAGGARSAARQRRNGAKETLNCGAWNR